MKKDPVPEERYQYIKKIYTKLIYKVLTKQLKEKPRSKAVYVVGFSQRVYIDGGRVIEFTSRFRVNSKKVRVKVGTMTQF